MSQIEAVEKPKSKSETTKPRPNHPAYLEMVITAIKELDDSRKTGSSKQAITKYIKENNEIDPSKASQCINAALRDGVTSGRLTQLKGKGANRSFRLGEESGESTKKKTHATKPAKFKHFSYFVIFVVVIYFKFNSLPYLTLFKI